MNFMSIKNFGYKYCLISETYNELHFNGNTLFIPSNYSLFYVHKNNSITVELKKNLIQPKNIG